MAFGNFPLDVLSSVSPFDIILPRKPIDVDRSAQRTSACKFHEEEKGYSLSLMLPGVSPADLKLSIEDGMLTISGATKTDTQTYRASYRVRVPSDADPASAKAAAEHGILSITLSKRPKVTHEIAVASSSAGPRKTTEDDYVLNLPFPGVRPCDFKVVCEDSVLSIAIDTSSTQQATKTVKRILPADADVSAATAFAEHGILTISLPRRSNETHEEGPSARSTHLITVTNGSGGSPTSSK
ncbi:hypothetical protein AB1Y20_000176 [Prymnesium parvum]|uniref:SHSP domain-containing protein n=1 Tax=Prymnesium parvum TaxID=97485 RepID=A0AB34K565_PRYPA